VGLVVRAVPDVRTGLPGGEHAAPDIMFGKIDTEDQPELSAAARISSSRR